MGLLDIGKVWAACFADETKLSRLPADRVGSGGQKGTVNSGLNQGEMTAADDDCPICLSRLVELDVDGSGIVAPYTCQHQICVPCLREALSSDFKSCQLCGADNYLGVSPFVRCVRQLGKLQLPSGHMPHSPYSRPLSHYGSSGPVRSREVSRSE